APGRGWATALNSTDSLRYFCHQSRGNPRGKADAAMERNQCITDFKVVGRRAPKVTVFLDGEEWATLEAETVVREGLRRDDRLDEARREAILAADAAIRARRAAAGHAA